MNNKLASHLQYGWWKYLAVILAVVLGWSYVFYLVALPEDNEKLVITFFGEDLNSSALQNHLVENYAEVTDQYLEQISIENLSSTESNLNALLDDRTRYSDLVILTEDMLTRQENAVNMHTYSRRIPIDKLRALLGDVVDSLQFYLIDYDEQNKNMQFGIYLSDPNDGVTTRFEQFYTGSERCVLFFGFQSVNLGQLYDLGSPADVAGLDALIYLLEVV